MSSSQNVIQQLEKWRLQIKQARSKDYRALHKILKNCQKDGSDGNFTKFTDRLEKSLALVKRIKDNQPKITFPEELPISQRRDEIAELIKNNQILIVAGETGSGKTTQLPKICLELGYGARGLIGHTQPRRIAARTVADRIASELKTTLGETVGYQVRFKDLSNESTQIKLMTDGVLLAEIQRDRLLSRYEVIIIDEAHERSLNIDFLLGLLKPLCKKRPDLKVIITSATIDLEKFAKHFSMNGKSAPIIEVSGRTYPVDVIYDDIEDSGLALEDAITQSVSQVIKGEAQGVYKANGDILVFCSGERDIRDTAKALRNANLPIDVLPLYARLSVQEQNKAFQPSKRRKVVLATNVAETSITVPGIAYVIDPGLARISRYSFRSKVQRLPIEEVSQASANQRKGRCGRVADGVCIRLYSEDNFNKRDEFTAAEILRSNLASVILQMRRLHIRDIEHFDFIDKPDSRLLNDGLKLLQELNALDKDQQLTPIGKQLSVIPVDPRYARILVAAQKSLCLRDALVIISALSIRDPRERPSEFRQKADEKHKLTQHPQSDFYSYLYLWQAINDKREELSSNQFKKYCVKNFWSISRVFEWRELYRQLATVCKELKWNVDKWKTVSLPEIDAPKKKQTKKSEFDQRYIGLHKSLLAGLLSNIATKELDKEYTATRNRKVDIFPGSALAKRSQNKQSKNQAKWLVAAEFLETSKMFLHTVAEIDPEWVIESAGHLCKYSYSDPKYNGQSGNVLAQRKTLLSGLVLRDKESINYAAINPKEARQLFIQRGLVEGLYQYRHKNKSSNKKVGDKTSTLKKTNNKQTKNISTKSFTHHNSKVITDIKKLETKTRRRNLLVSEEIIYAFYDKRIPETVVSRASFEKWYKTVENSQPELLMLSRDYLLQTDPESDEIAQFPDHLEINGKKLKLKYTFDPTSTQDGVSLLIPHALLAPMPEHIGSWLVPGLLREKCIALMKTLPKSVRRNFVPVSDAIDQVIIHLKPNDAPLNIELGKQLFRTRGIKISDDDWHPEKLDTYYQMNFRVLKKDGAVIAEGRNIKVLKKRYTDSVRSSIEEVKTSEQSQFELHNIKTWSFGDLPIQLNYQHQGMKVTAFPMLKILHDGSISLLLSYKQELANYHTSRAIIKLAQLQSINGNQKQAYQYLQKELFKTKNSQAQSASSSLADQLQSLKKPDSVTNASSNKWKNEVIDAALWESCFAQGADLPRNENAFKESLVGARQWVSNALSVETMLFKALQQQKELNSKIKSLSSKSDSKVTERALDDIQQQLTALFEPSVLRYTNPKQLKQYAKYLKAIEVRLEKIFSSSVSQNDLNALYKIQKEYDDFITSELKLLNSSQSDNDRLELDALYYMHPNYFDYAVMLQEWRVSLFAQQLKTRFPVSQKRLAKAFKELLV